MESKDVELDENSLKEILGNLGVSSVFGDPVKRGDISIIPVAEMKIGLGSGRGGGGRGKGEDKGGVKSSEGDDSGECSMNGYGGGGKVTPKGYIKFAGEKVSFEPILDVTKIAFAGIALVAWAIYWITRCCTCEED